MVYIEVTCNNCGADVGYGSALGSEPIEQCPHCKSQDLREQCYYDD